MIKRLNYLIGLSLFLIGCVFLGGSLFSGFLFESIIFTLFLLFGIVFIKIGVRSELITDFSRTIHYNDVMVRVLMIAFILLNLIRFSLVVIYGHQVLYLSPNLELFLMPLKVLAFPGYYLMLLIFYRKSEKYMLYALFALITVLLTGSRGLIVFGVLGYMVVVQYDFLRVKFIFGGFFVLLGFVLIGYLRESHAIDFSEYIFLVLASLNQFVFANLNILSCGVLPIQVLMQFGSVLFGHIDEARVTYELTNFFSPGAVENGYGIASSIVGESLLISSFAWPLVILVIIIVYSSLLMFFLSRRSYFWQDIGLSGLPFILYLFRSEIIYPSVFILKILISFFLLVIFTTIFKLFAASNEKNFSSFN